MMGNSAFLTDAATRHAMFIQRFATGEKNRLLKYVQRIEQSIVDKLTNTRLTEFASKKLALELTDLRFLIIEIYRSMGKELDANMLEFAKYEAEFSKKMFEKGIDATFALPSDDAIQAAIQTKPMNLSPGKDGYTIGTSLRQFEKKAATELVTTIKDGIVQGLTAQQIARDIRNITGNIQSQNVEALVRTVTNHVSTQARLLTMKENNDIIDGYQIIATLDSRTTIICAGLDGQIFPLNSNMRPPFHWGCRTTTKPVLKEKYDKLFSSVGGDRPSIGSSGVKAVPANTKFDTWLRAQSASFKQEYFSKLPQGADKYKLFEDGGLTLDKFTDSKNAQYSLAELKKLQPLAFSKAHIKPK